MFHRTESLDFGILHEGEISWFVPPAPSPISLIDDYFSRLDDGVRIDMKAGDTCVQRGTIHGWTNYSDKPARVYFILTGMKQHMTGSRAHSVDTGMTAAEAVEIDGRRLGDEGFDRKDVESGGAEA